MFLALGCTPTPPTTPPPTPESAAPTALRIEVPAQINAGEPLLITVHVTPADATADILFTAHGTFGFLPQQALATAGHAHFTMPTLHTQRAGVVQLRAAVDQLVTTTAVEILPGRAVDPVLPLVGPRSIVADGEHWTMAVTTPRDRWDNPVAEGTTVTLSAQHPVLPGTPPADGLEILETRMRGMLSWARIFSRTQAGRLLISARVDDAYSPERTVLEVPGPPTPFMLYANPPIAPADGHGWIQIRSDQITDRFGNVLLDGTQATILAALPPDEIRTVPAITVDGRLYATLQAPTQPGSMFVRAWIGAVSSQATQITFTPGPAVQEIPVHVTWQADRAVITAGPLVGEREQFVPDGTEVTFTVSAVEAITAPDGGTATRQVIVPAEYGYATLVVRSLTLTPGAYAVTVAAGTGTGNGHFTVPEIISPKTPDTETPDTETSGTETSGTETPDTNRAETDAAVPTATSRATEQERATP